MAPKSYHCIAGKFGAELVVLKKFAKIRKIPAQFFLEHTHAAYPPGVLLYKFSTI